jgi:hypothetical protein
MLEGTCLCGAVSWRLDADPDVATACNCRACRRHGGLWAYGHEDVDIQVCGATHSYIRSDAGDPGLTLHRCAVCGNIAYWRALKLNDEGRRRMGVNLRLAEPETVAAIRIKHFDGLDTWTSLPSDGRCVRDMWF